MDSIEFYTWAEGFFQEREELLGRVLAFTLKSVVEVNEDELTASTVLEVELAYSCPALPVGGHRFRPSMEDLLYFTINECGFRAKENWEATLLSTRREWLDTQCRAAVRDSPEVAVDALKQLGYTITPPEKPQDLPRRHDVW